MSLFAKILAMAAPKPAPIIELVAVEAEEPASATGESDADTRHQEKARLRAIVCSDEATGREALAVYLAVSTEMTVEDAKAALGASARSATPGTPANAAVSDKTARQRQMDADFAKAFSRAEFATPEQADEPETVIQRMQRNFHLAAGIKAGS